jgi:hypothetical protein
LAEITLIEAITSQQVLVEVERNLTEKLPSALPVFRLLVSRCLEVVPNPSPEEVAAADKLADPGDLPILLAAVRERCHWLVTFNLRHYQPGHPAVTTLRPGQLVQRVRELLTHLPPEAPTTDGE